MTGDNPPTSVTVPFLLDLALTGAPKPYKLTLINAFSIFIRALIRQKQLRKTLFNCDICDQEIDIDEILANYGLDREAIDPDRSVWVSEDVQRKFLLTPGQWVTLGKEKSSDGFICQLLVRKSTVREEPGACTITLNSTTEYNLRRTLGLSQCTPIPPLQIRPLLSHPLIRVQNGTLYSPINAKSVKLSKLKSSKDPSGTDCEYLVADLFARNCKYLCLGDVISVEGLYFLVSEVNDIRLNDSSSTSPQLFKVSQSSCLSINSNELINYFHPRLNINNLHSTLAPCLTNNFKILFNLITRALNRKCQDSDLWPNILIYGGIGSGKHSVCKEVAAHLGINFYFLNATSLIGDTSAYSEAKLRAVYDQIKKFCPCLIFVKNLNIIGKDKEGHEDRRVIMAFKEFLHDLATLSLQPVSNPGMSMACVLIGSSDSHESIVPSISQIFLHKLEFPSVIKSKAETEETLKWMFERAKADLADGFNFELWVKDNCDGLQRNYGDLKALAATVIRNAFCRMTKAGTTALVINEEDLNSGLKSIDAAIKKATNNIEVPKVSWEDIGGLEDVKKELINSVKLPLEFPHLFASGIRRSGILLYGPPGTGKTLIAKAVATEFKLSFLSVKGPELLNMYVGQSEKNVREVFAKARNSSPCIIFFDELDALAPNRGRAGDSGGVMDRVVSQILAELDGTHSTPDVFIIGATNRPDLIDPALLRPGRLDKLLNVGINQSTTSKISVLKALTRKFQLDEDVDLPKLAESIPHGMSGADLYSLCSDAYMVAVERQISQLPDSTSVLVKQCDFEAAVTRTSSSLSGEDQVKYEALKNMTR